MDEPCVQPRHLENKGQKKRHSSGSNKKEQYKSFKEKKNKWKGGKNKMKTIIAYQCKYPSNNYKHYNIYGHIEEKCRKLYRKLNPKNHKRDINNKNPIVTNSNNQVEISSNMDKNIVCAFLWKKINLSRIHQQEEKDMIKIFHIKIQVNKTNINALLNSSSQENIIPMNLVKKIGLEVLDHPSPYPLGWVNNEVEIN